MTNEDTLKRVEWRVGLQNPAEKFLTAEPFGYKVNAAALSMKNKQIWILELNRDESVFIKSHFGRYLSADKFGNVSCENESRGEDEKFIVEYATDGTGRWAFKNARFKYYLGGTDDNLQCLARAATDDELSLWYVPMAIHPQVALRNVNRDRYVKLVEDGLQCTEVTPWGPECVITLEFICGKYSFKSPDNRYLNRDGSLTYEHGKDTRFSVELKIGADSNLTGISFKDCEGHYLTGYGVSGIIKTRNKKVGKDELFTLEESHPQVVFVSPNGKNASIRGGIHVSANTIDETNKEIFQIEFDKISKKWTILTIDGMYWSLGVNGGIQADASLVKENCLFDIIWHNDGTGTMKAQNGKYVYNKPTGIMMATSDTIDEKEKFKIKLVNRTLIVLKGEYGYVGLKTSGTVKTGYLSTKAVGDILFLEHDSTGSYFFRSENGKYWEVGEEERIHASGTNPVPFVVEFLGNSIMTIRAPNEKYVMAEKSGGFRAIAEAVSKPSMWRY